MSTSSEGSLVVENERLRLENLEKGEEIKKVFVTLSLTLSFLYIYIFLFVLAASQRKEKIQKI